MSAVMNSKSTGVQPTIISVAESTHYLIGVMDGANNFTGLDGSSQMTTANSLSEAKQFLRNHHYFSAALEYQSAYDEMCGTNSIGRCQQIIIL